VRRSALLFGLRFKLVAGNVPSVPNLSRNLGYFAIPQAWFSTGDAKPVRELMRDLESVNREP